jgi:RimJ/RimL family protein N-acetyltransferase
MLVPAITYKEEIEREFKKIQYTDKWLWYTGWIDNYDIEVKTEGDKFAFAIIEPAYEEVVGYVSFRVDWYCSMAYNFSLIKFKDVYSKGKQLEDGSWEYIKISTRIMASAIREVMKMVESFNLHRIDFRCVSGNPAEKQYDGMLHHLIKRYQPTKMRFTDNIKDTHGNYHDTIVYELIRREE